MHGTAARTGLVILFGIAALPVAARQQPTPSPASREAQIEELWAEPEANRDLLYGVGGRDLAPDPNERYKVREIKLRGFSEGYTVIDSQNREWSTKAPPEAFSEIATSRILWAVGFHQPPNYVLVDWKAEGARGPNPQLPARFREKEPKYHGIKAGGTWSFKDNPFVGTRPFGGLMVLQAMLANPDLKASNNTIYTLTSPAEGASRWYVVRDLGYSLGSTGFNAPRADIEAFERTPFIRSVTDGKVQLYFGGVNKSMVRNVTVAEVQWICQRLAKLTDAQWRDAFRAAAYEPSVAERYIVKLKAKIKEGLAVR